MQLAREGASAVGHSESWLALLCRGRWEVLTFICLAVGES